MRPLHFFYVNKLRVTFLHQIHWKEWAGGVSAVPKGWRWALWAWRHHDHGQDVSLSSGCPPPGNNSNSVSWFNPRGKQERKMPINPIHEITSPAEIAVRFQWSHTLLRICLLPLLMPKVNLRLSFIQIWRVPTIVILRKIQCTTAHQKNNHPARGKKNSIAFTWLNKSTKARKFKVKFYTPSLVPHYCEREIKGTMACVRVAMSAVTALPGFYWLVS